MKTYEKRIRPASTYEAHVETKCDLCGGTTTNDWRESSFDSVETEVRLKTGSSYPEGGSGEEITIDICPKCFVEKLIPWVEAHGGKPTRKDWEW